MDQSTRALISKLTSRAVLSSEVQERLSARAAKGDVSARQELVLHNLRIAIQGALRYGHHDSGLEDRIQAACEGVVQAANIYDVRKGARFSTLATVCVANSLFSEWAGSVGLRRGQLNGMYDIIRARRLVGDDPRKIHACLADSGKSIPVDTIASFLGWYGSLKHSIQASIPGEDRTYEDIIADERVDVESKALRQVMSFEVEDLIDMKLQGRARDIVKRRFGFGRTAETLNQIGSSYGITRERVRQIEKSALRSLMRDDDKMIGIEPGMSVIERRLRVDYLQKRLSTREMAPAYGHSYKWVRAQLIKYGIPLRGRSEGRLVQPKPSKEVLEAEYKQLSIEGIALLHGWHRDTVSRWMDEYGIVKRDGSCAKLRREYNVGPGCMQVLRLSMTNRAVARACGVSEALVEKMVVRKNLSRKPSKAIYTTKESRRVALEEMMTRTGLAPKELYPQAFKKCGSGKSYDGLLQYYTRMYKCNRTQAIDYLKSELLGNA